MAQNIDIDKAMARARQAQEKRLESVRTLATARESLMDLTARQEAEMDELRKRHDAERGDAEKEDSKAYRAAVRAGWTEAELTKIGFEQTDKIRRSGRSKARRRRAAPKPSTESQPTPNQDGVSFPQ